MRLLLISLLFILTSCFQSLSKVNCPGGLQKHILKELPPVPVKNGTLIITVCTRTDRHGIEICNYRDTFLLKDHYQFYKGY